MSWYNTGKEAEQAAENELERQEAARKEAQKNANMARRFWLPAGAECYITILDGPTHPNGYPLPFVYNEHQMKLNGHWRNWFTCIGEECPICENDFKPSVVSAYTVINHSEWTDKKGNVHKDELNLLIAKPAVNKMLRSAASKRGGSLRGWYVCVNRTSSEGYSTGDSFDFLEKRELSDELQPADYIELFAPKTKEELQGIFGGAGKVVDADDGTVKF